MNNKVLILCKFILFIFITISYFYLVKVISNSFLVTIQQENLFGIISLIIYIGIILPLTFVLLKQLNK